MSKDDVVGVDDYDGAAAGWGALKAVADAVRGQKAIVKETHGLLTMNQPHGFDCPGCAWPDPKHTSPFEFCENGAKAVSWEATAKRTTPEFFAAHTVSQLWKWSDFDLENEGRLTHPMAYDRASDRYLPISWDEALKRIGAALRALPHPDMAEFYTSGRASNEAAFLYQLFAREFGTNNFPDCSNMCHEATSVGLPESIGVGIPRRPFSPNSDAASETSPSLGSMTRSVEQPTLSAALRTERAPAMKANRARA